MLEAANKEITLFTPDGLQLKSTTPEFDPDFLKSDYTLFGNASTAQNISKFPYEKHSWVYSCCQAINRPIKQLEAVLFNIEKPKELIFDHPLLAKIDQPNPFQTRSEFIESILLNLQLPTTITEGGQCFIIPTDANGEVMDLTRGDLPECLWPYSDLTIQAKVVENVFYGWEWTMANGVKRILQNYELIRIYNVNRKNMLLGMSPYSALRQSVTTDAKAAELSEKFLDNNATVGKFFTTEQSIQQQKLERIKASIREQNEGYGNAGKSLVLHSGMKMDTADHSLVELEFIEQRRFTREEIQAAYGVGNMQMGLVQDVNRSTAEVSMEEFWSDTLLPYIDKIWIGLNTHWIRYADKRNLQGYFDLSDVSALRKDQGGKIERADKLIDQGVPPSTAYKTVGLDIDIDDMPWLDEPWVTGVRTNLKTGELVGKPAAAPAPPSLSAGLKSYGAKSTQEERLLYWEDMIEKTQGKTEKTYKRMIIAFWNDQRNAFQDQADKVARGGKAMTKASMQDFMIPKKPQDEKLIKNAMPIYQKTIELQSIQMATELGELVNWDPQGPEAKLIRDARKKFLRDVNSVTFNKMGKEINKIIDKNPGVAVTKLAKLIKQAEGKVMGARIGSSALTVSRTETSAITSGTRFNIMKVEGVEKHSWVTAGDELVRNTHSAEGSGPPVKVGEPFPVTGLLFPLAEGDPAETVNCRCAVVPEK
jgi:HK97 family phage portal protein